ncbi:glycosyl transferase [Methylobacterium sp. Leaf466]|nr:glycosyl transferase [Methylobacterium sp. Leaf466]
MLGLRGIPDLQGGVERHVQELARRLARAGCSVEVLGRARYLPSRRPYEWCGVRVTPLFSPRNHALESIVHTLLGVLYAAWVRPDILHIHAIGPSLLVPLARVLGLRVVVTHHGFDYDREKWGRLARAMLRIGEWTGMRFSSGRIAVSHGIASVVAARHAVAVSPIPNGVTVHPMPQGTGTLARFGLEPGRYVVMVSRLVPEKRHLDLIDAFARAALLGWKLALVGGADHADSYSREVLNRARRTAGVVTTGFQSGPALQELLAHAGLFVLPSSHEGLPIALLEALSYGVRTLSSDIPPNREVGLPDTCYFPVRDVGALVAGMARACARLPDEAERTESRERIRRMFDWDVIAARTRELYITVQRDPAARARAPGRAPLSRPGP